MLDLAYYFIFVIKIVTEVEEGLIPSNQ